MQQPVSVNVSVGACRPNPLVMQDLQDPLGLGYEVRRHIHVGHASDTDTYTTFAPIYFRHTKVVLNLKNQKDYVSKPCSIFSHKDHM